jgi:5-methylcytosine-specific restriction protein A
MPSRIPNFRPPRVPAPRRGDTNRPNAAARGYCSKAWRAIRRQVLVRDAWKCVSCGRVCGDRGEAHVDHVVPKSAGGTDTLENLQTMCVRCHSAKTAREDGGFGRSRNGVDGASDPTPPGPRGGLG